MSIQEILLKLKGSRLNTEFLLAVLIVIVSVSSFFLGRISVAEKSNKIQQKAQIVELITQPVSANANRDVANTERTVSTQSAQSSDAQGAYVASKSGTKYHLPWCAGARSIKEENKVYFASKEEAEARGYEPAANCKGI